MIRLTYIFAVDDVYVGVMCYVGDYGFLTPVKTFYVKYQRFRELRSSFSVTNIHELHEAVSKVFGGPAKLTEIATISCYETDFLHSDATQSSKQELLRKYIPEAFI